jgi:hypothetical protein
VHATLRRVVGPAQPILLLGRAAVPGNVAIGLEAGPPPIFLNYFLFAIDLINFQEMAKTSKNYRN